MSLNVYAGQPRPQAPVQKKAGQQHAAAQKPAGQKQAADNKPEVGPEVDKVSDAFGLQGFVQDSAKVAKAVTVSAGRANRVATAVSGLAEGEDGSIANMVSAASRGVGQVAARMSPAAGARLTRVATPVLEGTGKAVRALGRFGPIVSIPFAGYDVYKAVAEKDPAKKDGAWANAALSVGGTAMGAIGALAMATPAGVPLLIGSAVVGGFQLLDTYAFDGKCTDWLGKSVKKVFQRG
jgi:hypothetical protein